MTHGFLQYIRLKAIISLLRILNYIFATPHFKPSATCNRKKVRIPSKDLGRFIDAWIYYPPNYHEDEPRGVVVNWHGGGYVMTNLSMDHQFCERVARDCNVLVLDADYRKAPEHPFPGAVEDARDVFRWVGSQPRLFDADRVALTGFSAGGHLALVAASELRKEFTNLNIRAVYPFYPGTDFTIAPESKSVPEPIRPLPVFAQHLFADCYLPKIEDRATPLASPMYANPLSFPPNVLIFVCSGDILAPETEVFGEKLKKARPGVEVVKVQGAGHGFDKTINPRLYKPKEQEETYSKVVQSLNSVM